jgi:hypothetical protein
MEGSVMIRATSIHQRSSERSCLPFWNHTRAFQGAGWDMSISPFFSSRREPAQVGYIGICRGGPRAGKRMAELVKDKKIFFREGPPTSDDENTVKFQGAYQYLDGAWLWRSLA